MRQDRLTDVSGDLANRQGRRTFQPVPRVIHAALIVPPTRDVQPMLLSCPLESGAADVFGPGGGTAAQPAVDVKSLHAKIGELILENDF
jgi:hypothetical protein